MSPQPKHNLRNRKVICQVVLFGTYLVIAAIAILLFLNFSMSHNNQLFGRLFVCGMAFLYIGATHLLLRRNYYHAVGYLLVGFYTLLATGIVWTWSINTPIGILIFGLVIVLAGILLTARHALFTAILSGLILIGTQVAIIVNWHKPDTSWTSNASSFGDALAYCTAFSMLALISWLYNREMERSLAQARQAEAALLKQKTTLEIQVKKRTAQLRQAQLEEMQQMYRFAELGQLGVTLLHDLANHLTALTLEIEGMQSRQQSKAITRARRIIRYLDSVVDSTRERLHGSTKEKTFNIIQKTSEVVSFLNYKAAKAGVVIDWYPPARSLKYTGDQACFCQIIAIVTSNAIEAYNLPDNEAAQKKVRRVVVTMQRDKSHIIILINDWGRGIPKKEREELFKLSHSTKKTGLGLGLFIARQMVETNFSGTIELDLKSDHTEFIIKLPRANAK